MGVMFHGKHHVAGGAQSPAWLALVESASSTDGGRHPFAPRAARPAARVDVALLRPVSCALLMPACWPRRLIRSALCSHRRCLGRAELKDGLSQAVR